MGATIPPKPEEPAAAEKPKASSTSGPESPSQEEPMV